MIAMAMVIPVAAIAAPTNKQEADFSQRPGGGGGGRAQRAQSRGQGARRAPCPLLWQSVEKPGYASGIRRVWVM